MTDSKVPDTTAEQKMARLATGGQVGAIVPTDVEQAWRLAQLIAASNMAPDTYERSAEKILIGIMHGMEVGFTPMAALQSIAVVNGFPSLWGDGLLAVIEASGELEELTEEPLMNERGDEVIGFRCHAVRAYRNGRTREVTQTFTLADATKAQLTQKNTPWKTYPQRMLQMRARSWALRDLFADVLRGLHSAEEMRDMGDVEIIEAGGDRPPPPARSDYTDAGEAAAEGNAEMDEGYRNTLEGDGGAGEGEPVEGSSSPAGDSPPQRQHGRPAPGKKRRTKAEIAEDEARDRELAAAREAAKNNPPPPVEPSSGAVSSGQTMDHRGEPEPGPAPEDPPSGGSSSPEGDSRPQEPSNFDVSTAAPLAFIAIDQDGAIASHDEVIQWCKAMRYVFSQCTTSDDVAEWRIKNKPAWEWIAGRFKVEAEAIANDYRKRYRELDTDD